MARFAKSTRGPELARTDNSMRDVAFVRDMLNELLGVAKGTGADVLVYLLEMAFSESEDLVSGKSPLNLSK